MQISPTGMDLTSTPQNHNPTGAAAAACIPAAQQAIASTALTNNRVFGLSVKIPSHNETPLAAFQTKNIPQPVEHRFKNYLNLYLRRVLMGLDKGQPVVHASLTPGSPVPQLCIPKPIKGQSVGEGLLDYVTKYPLKTHLMGRFQFYRDANENTPLNKVELDFAALMGLKEVNTVQAIHIRSIFKQWISSMHSQYFKHVAASIIMFILNEMESLSLAPAFQGIADKAQEIDHLTLMIDFKNIHMQACKFLDKQSQAKLDEAIAKFLKNPNNPVHKAIMSAK